MPMDDTKTANTKNANTRRRCFITPGSKMKTVSQTANHRRRIKGKSNPSIRGTSGATSRFGAVLSSAFSAHETHRRLGPARSVPGLVSQQPAVQPRSDQADRPRRQLERLGAAHERAHGHARRLAAPLL